MDARRQSGTWVLIVSALAAAALLAGGASAQQAGAPSPTSRADDIEGTRGDDTLDGKAGHDRLDGGRGADTLDGGPGRDFIRGEGGNDTIQARDGYVDAVHCGNGRDTVTADEKDAVSETCENVSPPPEADDTAKLAVLISEKELASVDPDYRWGLISIDMAAWIHVSRDCRPPCYNEGPTKPPNDVHFYKSGKVIGPGVPDFRFGILAMGDCWRHQGPARFDGSCTLRMDSDKVVWIEVWPCEIIPKSWRKGDVCAD